MDLGKFVWLLENSKLYLPRLDLLGDPHEGSTPEYGVRARDEFLRREGIRNITPAISESRRRLIRSTYVSCWYLGEEESEAMWKLYCPSNSGIAVKTSYKKLVESISSDPYLYIGEVTYLNYERESFREDNAYYPPMHKRISFKHEQEVRIVKMLSEYWTPESDGSPPGYEVDWSLSTTIDHIYVNPFSPTYFYDVVRSIVRRFVPEMAANIRWSTMRSEPQY